MRIFHKKVDLVGRAGPVERRGGDQILQPLRFQLHQHPLHTGGFKLKNALGAPGGKQGVDPFVINGNGVYIDAGCTGTVVDHGQRTQTEKVHFEQPQLLERGHNILRDRHAVVRGERHIRFDRVMRDDDAGRMGRRIARHALNFQRRIDQLVHRFVFCTGTAQLRRLFQRVSERNVKIARDQLGHGVYRRIRHAHGAPHVAHGGTRRQCTERNDLGDMVFAVLFGHIVDHFAAALIAKVDVKIRHADTFGI